jgi:membrane protease YdiL (CAAX protease family)
MQVCEKVAFIERGPILKRLQRWMTDDRTVWTLFILLAIPRLGAAFVNEFNFVVPVLYLLVAFLLWRHPERSAFGLRSPTSLRMGAIGIMMLTGIYLASSLLLYLIFDTTLQNWNVSFYRLLIGLTGIPVSWSAILLDVLILLFYPVEEFYFRGLLLSSLLKKHGKGTSIMVVAMLWAFLHIGVYGLRPFDGYQLLGMIPSVAAMGIVLGWIRVYSGSVYLSALGQGVGNLCLFGWCYFYLLVPGGGGISG